MQTRGALDTDSRMDGPTGAVAQNWRLLLIFNLYRLLLASSAAIIALLPHPPAPFGESSPLTFLVVSILYATVTIVSVETARRRAPGFEVQTSVYAFADIVLITLLMHASGGMASGLGLLLLISVASGGLLLTPRLSILFGALATLALLIEHAWPFLNGEIFPVDGLAQVGLLGFFLFATSGLFSMVAHRLRTTEALARRRGVDLANMGAVNELIIQRLQSGVLVCDRSGMVHRLNRTARDLLAVSGPQSARRSLRDLSPRLATQLETWNAQPANASCTIEGRPGVSLAARFAPIGQRQGDTGVVIFLDDVAVLHQQAQQVKLAALARLTASIAHEIRNPLGAIMQAAQLVAESPRLDPDDAQLVRIIEDQGRRMNTMVDNVLQLGRRDRMRPVRLGLRPWLRDFAKRYAEESGTPVEVFALEGAEAVACTDPGQLYQVVRNLCQNALRHSPEFAGTPVVRLRPGFDAEARPCLDVIDRGSGIPPEIVDNIFEPFFTTSARGTGLGLYVARQLCEGSGARLDYHPGDNGGSRFRITFMRAEECADHGTQ